jgi:hypothetical protein
MDARSEALANPAVTGEDIRWDETPAENRI